MRDIGRGARHGSPAVARAKKHILLAGAALETIEPLSRCLIHRASGGPEMAELSSRSSGRPPVESGPTGGKATSDRMVNEPFLCGGSGWHAAVPANGRPRTGSQNSV